MGNRWEARSFRSLFVLLLAVLVMGVYTVPGKAVFAAEEQAPVVPMDVDGPAAAPQNTNSGIVAFADYIVTYDPGAFGAWEPYSVPGCVDGSATPAPPSYYANSSDPGYVFSGWDPAVQPTVGGSATYVAQWVARPAGIPL